jgi:hypothetical protein
LSIDIGCAALEAADESPRQCQSMIWSTISIQFGC